MESMQITVHTDNHIKGTENLKAHVEELSSNILSRFRGRVTRLEIHLGDENGNKHGPADKRCMMEARLERRQPTAVTHHAETLDQAVRGAAHKLERALDSEVGRLADRR